MRKSTRQKRNQYFWKCKANKIGFIVAAAEPVTTINQTQLCGGGWAGRYRDVAEGGESYRKIQKFTEIQFWVEEKDIDKPDLSV